MLMGVMQGADAAAVIYVGWLPLALVWGTFGFLWIINVRRTLPWIVATILTAGCWFGPDLIGLDGTAAEVFRMILAVSPIWIVAAALGIDRLSRRLTSTRRPRSTA